MPLYLFTCKCGQTKEAIARAGTDAIDCACGEQAQRTLIYAPSIGRRAAVPREERKISIRAYSEATEQMAYQHAKAEESAQQPLPTPPLARMGIRYAKQLMAAGVKDASGVRNV